MVISSSVRLSSGNGLIDKGNPLKSPHSCHAEGAKRLKNLKNTRFFAPLRMTKGYWGELSNIYSGAIQILPSGDHVQFPNRKVPGYQMNGVLA